MEMHKGYLEIVSGRKKNNTTSKSATGYATFAATCSNLGIEMVERSKTNESAVCGLIYFPTVQFAWFRRYMAPSQANTKTVIPTGSKQRQSPRQPISLPGKKHWTQRHTYCIITVVDNYEKKLDIRS